MLKIIEKSHLDKYEEAKNIEDASSYEKLCE